MAVKVFVGTALGRKGLYLIDLENNRLEILTHDRIDPKAIEYIAQNLPHLTEEEKQVVASTKSRIQVD